MRNAQQDILPMQLELLVLPVPTDTLQSKEEIVYYVYQEVQRSVEEVVYPVQRDWEIHLPALVFVLLVLRVGPLMKEVFVQNAQ